MKGEETFSLLFFCNHDFSSHHYFPGMDRLTSNTESTGDVIIAVNSFPSVITQTEVINCLAMSYYYLHGTSSLGKGPSLTAREVVPRHPSRY